MTIAVYLGIYLSLLIFLAGCLLRVVRYARAPIHLRWELYPVPHENPERAAYGGSSFETSNRSTRPPHFNWRGELRATLPEIAFLRGLWEFNRRLWYASFLFHAGLYLTIATGLLIAAGASLGGPSHASFVFWMRGLYHATAYAGVVMTLSGAVALLFHRLTDPELKNYTSAADIFNLHFFILTYGLVAAGYLVRGPGTASASAVLRGLATFDTSLVLSTGFAVGLMLASALVAYIPFTHMAHFIAKYFTYHAVRWDDRENLRGGPIEAKLAKQLAYQPTWAAAHIGADGHRTWAEIAAMRPAQEVRK
ncbi:MAG: respiratory nitrate reductase subunit gamma [Acidobacteriia bacterium]|nr:respiratory nitrate reductase subunit gamma [Terriglobia bacterium]